MKYFLYYINRLTLKQELLRYHEFLFLLLLDNFVGMKMFDFLQHLTFGYIIFLILVGTIGSLLAWPIKIFLQKNVKYFKDKREKSRAEEKEYLEQLKKDADLKMNLGFGITRRLISISTLTIIAILVSFFGSLNKRLLLIASKFADDPEIQSMSDPFFVVPFEIGTWILATLGMAGAYFLSYKVLKEIRMLRKSIDKPQKEKVGTVHRGGAKPTHVDLFKDDDS